MNEGSRLGIVHLEPFLGSAGRASWRAVAELSNAIDYRTWMIVGGQMVNVHLASAGIRMFRVTTDIDVVLDLRVAQRKHAVRVSTWLVENGFSIERNIEGTDRFRREEARIDLLTPDNLGGKPVEAADGGKILAAPGTTRALSRTTAVRADLGGGLEVVVRCPTAFGALVLKAEACVQLRETASRRLRHEQDIVALAQVLARQGYEDDRSERERQRFERATDPFFKNVHHEARMGANEDAREILRILRAA